MNNTHLLKIKYLGWTDTLPARLRITSYRLSESVVLNIGVDYDSILKQAIDYLESKGFDLINSGELSDSEYFITSSTFEGVK